MSNFFRKFRPKLFHKIDPRHWALAVPLTALAYHAIVGYEKVVGVNFLIPFFALKDNFI
jgi:hypothetical protein